MIVLVEGVAIAYGGLNENILAQLRCRHTLIDTVGFSRLCVVFLKALSGVIPARVVLRVEPINGVLRAIFVVAHCEECRRGRYRIAVCKKIILYSQLPRQNWYSRCRCSVHSLEYFTRAYWLRGIGCVNLRFMCFHRVPA
jgi:hypothetical protein